MPGETRVLLVEDNDMNMEMLSRSLKRKKFSVLEAVDGQQGVDMAKSELPDIILMDIGLPVFDGLEATRQIKGNDATRHIPIIALTAHAMSGDLQEALQAGCDDYETKPIELDRLLEKMKKLL